MTKKAKVGVASAAMDVVTGPKIGTVGLMHAPVAGSVSHSAMLTGKLALPVSAETVIVLFEPTFTVATAKAAEPVEAGRCTIPSPVSVAANAIISATGPLEAESSNVLIPAIVAAGLVFVQSNSNSILVGMRGALGVKENTKLCDVPT